MAPILLLRTCEAGWQRYTPSLPHALSEVVLLCPYITLTRVHSLKRPSQTLSWDDDIFVILLTEVCMHPITVIDPGAQTTGLRLLFRGHIRQDITSWWLIVFDR